MKSNLWQVIRLNVSEGEILHGDAFQFRTEDGTHNLLLQQHQCNYHSTHTAELFHVR